MKTLILCDSGSRQYQGLDLCRRTQEAVQNAGSEVQAIALYGDEIRPCLGCFGCWVKTPGLCVMTEDCVNSVARQEIQSDALVILSKITYGGYSYDIKSFLDRSIPNISPLFEVVDNTMRHKMRYERFPDMISIGYGAPGPAERQTFINLAAHNAMNMRPMKHFAFAAQNTDEFEETMKSLEAIINREVQS